MGSDKRSDRSHPSTRKRLKLAEERVLQFIGDPTTEKSRQYVATISGTADIFDALLARLGATPADLGLKSFELPPAGFNPQTASEGEFQRFGVLPCPSDESSALYREFWKSHVLA